MTDAPMSDAILCTLCPKMCRFACPVASATADEGATPTAKLQAWLQARDGWLSWDEAAEALSRCTGCEACRVPCEYSIDVPSLVHQARAEAWRHDAAPPATRALAEACADGGNPFGIDVKTVLIENARRRDFDKMGRVLYWPGCRELAETPERLPAEMDLLRAIGASHVSLPTRRGALPCCGAALKSAGDRGGFVTTAQTLEPYFNRQRTVVTPCGQCLLTLSEGYVEAGAPIHAETLHVAEYLLFFRGALADLGRRAMERAKPALPRLFVHDSCALHRRLERSEAVYEALEAATGLRPEPFGPTPGRTSCCGAGDFHDLRRPEAARATAEHSVRHRPLPEGAVVITGDRTCLESLRGALPDDLPVHDLMGFLVEWLAPALDEGG
jgi:Fe-S oxidoreductase